MELLYKPDWEQTKARLRAWWAHEVIDRCAIAVHAPKADAPAEAPPPLPAKVEERWLDHEYLRAINDYRLRHTFFGGESFPIWCPGYPGWDFVAVFLGARVTLMEDTAWVDPVMGEGELTEYDHRKLAIAPDNPWWRRALEMLHLGAKEAQGKAIPTSGTLGGCGDTLAALRGSRQLLLDVADCPDYVREFELSLMKLWCEVYDIRHAITREAAEGSAGWFPLWSPGKFYATHCDFAYMISPKMFSDVFLPAIEMQTNFLDHAIHHVDGVGNFAHVDALCELPHLQALQIAPGAGKPSPLHYMEVLRKVQAAGKNLHISLDVHEVESALRELQIEDLFIATACGSEEQARALLANVEKWSAGRAR